MLSKEILKFIKEKFVVVSDSNITEAALTDGRSGAEVYRVKIQSRRERLSGNYIIKICGAEENGKGEDEEEDDGTEISKAKILSEAAPKFAAHLVKVEAERKIDGAQVIIYSQANNSVRDTVPFSSLNAELLSSYAETTAYDILYSMNEEFQTGGTVSEFFNCLLAKQLSEKGRFAERVGSLLDNPNAECIVLNGEVYPNPLYFMQQIETWSESLSDCLFIKGIVHGDLHGNNILAARNSYSIIDYDSVSKDSYLFFDQAYFELSYLNDNSKDNDLKQWSELLERLITPSLFEDAEPCEHYLEYKVRNAVCRGITRWMQDRNLEKRKDDIEIQFIMARIAAGVNFLCKKTCAGTGRQIKILFYIAHCFKLLLRKSNYSCDENDITGLSRCIKTDDLDQDLWEGFIKFTNYIPILITDDAYHAPDNANIKSICGINWSVVIDIGKEESDSIVYKSLLENCRAKEVKKINLIAGDRPGAYNRTLNILSINKSEDISYNQLWRKIKNSVQPILKSYFSENPQVPLVLVFDCSKDSLSFRNQIANSLCDMNLPGGTRFVSLRTGFSKELKDEFVELAEDKGWRFKEYLGVTLADVARACEKYLSKEYHLERCANLPSLNGIYTFMEKDLISFESSIDLVYAGCERSFKSDLNQSGFDLSGEGDSLGEQFYKGNEAAWNDIANHRDLPLIIEKEYQRELERLLELINVKSPRVKTVVLRHGAGTGGTTLSKRILWDLKERIPCARLKKYSLKTASILLEIYQKTGKCVLLAVESGSTVATSEELHNLKKEVDSQNGKLAILLVKRIDSSEASVQKETEDTIMKTLSDTMPITIADNFKNVFSAFAASKKDSEERQKLLTDITGKDDLKDQRSPFFYGFYAFQEEYNLLHSLKRTVSDCSPKERELLNNLALVTAFSQNVCITFAELCSILDVRRTDHSMNIFVLLEKLPSALFKLTVIHEKGLRLCHKVIAVQILRIIHGSDEKQGKLDHVVFKATMQYIQSISDLYESDNEYVDNVLRELIIDRAYIDTEERKTKFSKLIESIPIWTDREELFKDLITKFPQNPHYYNHMARLLASGDKGNDIIPRYEKAVGYAKKAISAAAVAVSTHKTTLGCIYGQWILSDIKSEIKNKKHGRLSYKFADLIANFSIHYSLAKAEFEDARKMADISDSFNYFPQINMEYEIISLLIQYGAGRSLDKLIEQEAEFCQWYDEHFSIAVELVNEMKKHIGDDATLLTEAKSELAQISTESTKDINRQLSSLLYSDKLADRRHRRSLVYSVYARNGCGWSEIDPKTLVLAEQCFRKNFSERDENHNKFDIETWFELYRRVDYFQADEAQSLIADYMEDGYRKEYLLFLMTFIMRKNGMASASVESIIRRVSETNRLARLQGVNCAREHDFYVGSGHGAVGCPIVSVKNVSRNEKGEPQNLKEFTGMVTEVEQTHGKILLDGLNLDVTFIPKLSSATDNVLRTFEREDIKCRVKLNLMFSYSGLRGWDVIKI